MRAFFTGKGTELGRSLGRKERHRLRFAVYFAQNMLEARG